MYQVKFMKAYISVTRGIAKGKAVYHISQASIVVYYGGEMLQIMPGHNADRGKPSKLYHIVVCRPKMFVTLQE